jgi:hypothetical protein
MSSSIKKDIQTDSQVMRKNGALLIGSMIMTFALFRLYLQFAPDTDLNVGRYNIHHLFTGLLLIAAGGIPLAVCHGSTRRHGLALITFGVGLGMALDEWVYLIATDGSNASYLLPVSFWGGVTVIGLACVYASVLMRMKGRSKY